MLTYVAGDELADWEATIEVNGATLDMSTGWTFRVTCAEPGATATLFTKTANITGTTTGAVVSWATTGELSTLTAGIVYELRLRCRRTSDSRDVTIRETVKIIAEIA